MFKISYSISDIKRELKDLINNNIEKSQDILLEEVKDSVEPFKRTGKLQSSFYKNKNDIMSSVDYALKSDERHEYLKVAIRNAELRIIKL